MATRPRGTRGLELAADLSAVALAWLVALLTENIVLGAAWGTEFSGAWEVSQVRRLVVPMAVAGLAPVTFVVVGWWRVALLASRRALLARAALGALGAVAATGLALGISHGRHFASPGVRAAFVLVLAALTGVAGYSVVPRLAGWLRTRALATVLVGLGLGVGAWMGDAFVLSRLYPPFHAAMLIVSLSGFGLVGLGLRARVDVPLRVWTPVSVLAGLLVVVAAAWTPRATARLERLSNLRTVVLEHAPMLGRTVELAVLARRPQTAATMSADVHVAPGEVARSLDWSGHDVVLVSVDALRADHVSAYGYTRPTTPNLDALAAEGALFTAAYCPTPHTSYSVTSMMTGKYLRPLLALGLGEDSDTWAQDLRLYGWRTAAFYPPAVFFIDEERFPRFEHDKLGFEYAKVEFADPALREQQVTDYLQGAPRDKPLFLWVHFFEPHEPYVLHADHVFTGGASADVDAYDGEVATADDGIGRIVRAVRSARPGAVVIVTADHGEEFGEHGGRYHGTTVYEEQVRVPLVISGPGVRRGGRVTSVVQTIDLLPTTLSALGLPRPARLRGRDLGPLLAGAPDGAGDHGFAFAETDDYALVASGDDRLVCQRRAAACSLYDLREDELERHDLSAKQPARLAELRAELLAVERDHGHFESTGGPVWPEALRRGLVGDVEAAPDVAALLDDADVEIRRKAAEVAYALHAPVTVPQLRRALARDEDDEVRRWVALALVRTGAPPPPLTDTLLRDPSPQWRRRTALALGERGSPRACEALDAWWTELAPTSDQPDPDGEPPQLAMDLPHTRELLAATAHARCRGAVPALLASLRDVRARPYVADALGAIGDDRARPPLLRLLGAEPYVTTRPHEAEAILALEAAGGVTQPTLLGPAATVRAPRKAPKGPARLVVLLSDPGAPLEASADGRPLGAALVDGPVRSMQLPPGHGPIVQLVIQTGSGTIRAIWVAPSAALD